MIASDTRIDRLIRTVSDATILQGELARLYDEEYERQVGINVESCSITFVCRNESSPK